jgi:hypothetical protein
MVVWKQRQAGLVGRAVIYHAEAGISYNVSCPLEPLTTICLRLGGERPQLQLSERSHGADGRGGGEPVGDGDGGDGGMLLWCR